MCTTALIITEVIETLGRKKRGEARSLCAGITENKLETRSSGKHQSPTFL
jgi:hypothetical protein